MIEFKNVSKRYMTKTALRDVDLKLDKGKIIGLVGLNGAGKSTTMKLIAGLINPSKGSVELDGEKVTRRIASKVSYLSELDEYYSFYTVQQTIDFFATQFPDFNKEKAEEIRAYMNLDANTKVKHLSKGNRGRLKIILTLSREVPVLLMDEPLSGLDPLVRDSIVKGLITFVDTEKQLVLLSTHQIMEVEMILDEVIAIKDGELVDHRNVEELRYDEQKGILEWMSSIYE
ncbi:ABC transporter ATP-binding protein [Terribacillus saccharophilus]|uniref:ABC-2 type transport system ATP-binding protein n=1 Tax=Terribacillus saccharophilus TaxID=361277 RepID=A0A075LFG0_9BACI|nr:MULTISPECIES: ABC transporter ATP-binding protein [Terribacillus]AIF65425.1 spermidine/putrescine ABC transporter ATP-binding protein [Terribacillus goriensis]MCM3227153.1 ABC transporter ATP-binding protein [Terribacillus saccharophilus]MEC0284158.1 ABC transporter ATP-binding protein [Terribacillus saccharophilus]MEC0289704.1 ABC transporter ATP-binding protein [Terribacillus saccharophilus]MEC0301514.1 ABC transporter ATP-binding protein [Terribacillus saccharophilus]